MTPHETAIRQAHRTNAALKRLVAQLGTQAHPRGRVLAAYRQARRALAGQTDDRTRLLLILADLRQAIEAAVDVALVAAVEAGQAQAQAEIDAYGLPQVTTVTPAALLAESGAQAAILAAVNAQAAQVRALAASGAGQTSILGDAARVGALGPALVLRETARWLTTAANRAAEQGVGRAVAVSGRRDEFRRQAVATIDERTTNCCLLVHGQVVGMDEPFRLEGAPRYADKMMHPGFHDYCRTVEIRVPVAVAAGEVTQRMLAEARALVGN